jgi:hypothetical protein
LPSSGAAALLKIPLSGVQWRFHYIRTPRTTSLVPKYIAINIGREKAFSARAL